MSNVVVVGLGYVGLPLAVRAAEVGHNVTGVDLDNRKIEAIQERTSYIEDVTDTQLQTVLDSGNFTASRAMPGVFDIAIIAVPTPMKGHSGEPDLSYVESAGQMIAAVLARGATVVLESTTYPGTTENLLAPLLEEGSGLIPSEDFHLGFSPERIDPGPTGNTLQNTPKLVSATTPEGLQIIKDFYDTIVDETVPVSTPATAEMTKLFENIQANTLIALSNEVAQICHDLGIDFYEMIDAAMTKGHSMSRWTPGPGVGGHCLPIDPLYLAWYTRSHLGRPFKFAELADEVNNSRPDYVVQRAAAMLNDQQKAVNGSKILILGTAYKPNVGDVRESPALPIVKGLQERGAQVTVTDPHVDHWDLSDFMTIEEFPSYLKAFDLVILVTDHDAFDYDKIAEAAPTILDCRNRLQPNDKVVML